MKNLEKEIQRELSKLTKVKFNDETLLKKLGIDSLDLVELITEVEEKYEIEISDEELETIKKVGDIIKVCKKAAK